MSEYINMWSATANGAFIFLTFLENNVYIYPSQLLFQKKFMTAEPYYCYYFSFQVTAQ